MRLNKLSNFVGFNISKIQDYIRSIDMDVSNLFLFTQGRVRVGPRVDNTFSENISGEIHTFTTLTTTVSGLNTDETDVAHSLGTETNMFITISQDKPGTLFASTGVSSTHTYLRSNATATTYTILLLK